MKGSLTRSRAICFKEPFKQHHFVGIYAIPSVIHDDAILSHEQNPLFLPPLAAVLHPICLLFLKRKGAALVSVILKEKNIGIINE